jgi:hypothetical protein
MVFSHWQCQECNQPIQPEEGEVEIWYRRRHDGVERDIRRPGARHVTEHIDKVIEEMRDPAVVPHVHHLSCRKDAYGDDSFNDYGIPLTEVHSLELWVVKVNDLLEKVWIGKLEAGRLLLFWWQHKGARVPGT